MKELTFVIGQRVSGYLVEDGLAFLGYISGFAGKDATEREMAMVKIESTGEYEKAHVDTFHPMPLDLITHNKQTFLAAASRCSPCLYFKDAKSRRDYLEGLWAELQNYSQK
jgi:hypothetical protein